MRPSIRDAQFPDVYLSHPVLHREAVAGLARKCTRLRAQADEPKVSSDSMRAAVWRGFAQYSSVSQRLIIAIKPSRLDCPPAEV